ncbi:MAG TPA: hypothetical protein PLO61_05370 [Fimbriimonadaceae bacterium]|nr:hypothetical protein [Fimbriimonadaceae bacterium]HRJ33059.1 hypothetical protein [Fimbriimonadaceae bacterium]
MSAAFPLQESKRSSASLRLVKTKKKSGARRFAEHLASGALIMLASYLVATMLGQIAMEKARRDGLQSATRAREAKLHVAILRERVGRLSTVRAIDEWAELHGMKSSSRIALESAQGGTHASRR